MEETRQTAAAGSTLTERVVLWMICAVGCALFVFAAVRFHFGPVFGSFFNSDAAVPVLLADEILRTGNPLPTNWYFGNDEIWALAPHVFVMPFVAALGASTLALKLGNLLCIVVMALFIALPLHRITRSWPYAMVVAAGVSAPFSGFQEMAVYSQTAYGWFTAEFAILVYLALRMLDENGPEPWRLFGRIRWTTALYALFLVNLAIDSPLRTAAYWLAPVLAVVVVFSASNARARALAAVTIVAFLAGVLLHKAISMHVLAQPGTTVQLLNPIGEWKKTLATIARGLPVIIGYTQQWFATPSDLFGTLRTAFFAAAGILVVFAPAGNGPGSAECRFFARVSGAMLLIVLGVLIVGRLVSDPASDRYLVPPALLCLAALMAIAWCRLRDVSYAIAALAASFAIAFCGGGVMLVSRTPGPVASNANCDAPADRCRLRDLLAKSGVDHGYATYWKGNVTTVASGGAITTCGVLLSPRLAPFRWLVSKDCFDTPRSDRFFLAFDQAEIAQVSREFLIGEAGSPDRIVNDGSYEVWIYTTATAKLDWLKR